MDDRDTIRVGHLRRPQRHRPRCDPPRRHRPTMAIRPRTGDWPITIAGMLQSAPAPVETHTTRVALLLAPGLTPAGTNAGVRARAASVSHFARSAHPSTANRSARSKLQCASWTSQSCNHESGHVGDHAAAAAAPGVERLRAVAAGRRGAAAPTLHIYAPGLVWTSEPGPETGGQRKCESAGPRDRIHLPTCALADESYPTHVIVGWSRRGRFLGNTRCRRSRPGDERRRRTGTEFSGENRIANRRAIASPRGWTRAPVDPDDCYGGASTVRARAMEIQFAWQFRQGTS